MATATEEEHTRDVSHSLLISREVIPPTFSDDTVWIGFMDIVPVIGTVKEAVELVLALYEGNEAVMKEKEKAVEDIVNKSTLTDKPAADKYSGLINVREVREEMIIEYVAKGSKRGPKPLTPAQLREREREVEKIKKDMLEKIHIIEPKYSQELKEQLKEELNRSKKGEHVFNNDILKFHSKMLTPKYLNQPRYNQPAVKELGRHTLTLTTAEDIETNMVVDFNQDEFYVNVNAVLYGVYCRALRNAMLAVLRHKKPGDVTEAEKQRVNSVIYHMNYYQIYVDHMAKDKWIARQRGTRQARFEQVRQRVVHMYNTDRGVEWCIRILTEVAPLFNRQ